MGLIIVANQKITSYLRGTEVYANEMDILNLIEVRASVGLYFNTETGKTFPANINKVKEIDEAVYIKPVAETKKKSKVDSRQISMF